LTRPRIALIATIARTLTHHFSPVVRRLDDFQFTAVAAGAADAGFAEFIHVPFDRRPAAFHRHLASSLVLRRSVTPAAFELAHVNTPIPSVLARASLHSSTPLIYTVHGFHFHPLGGWWRNQAFRFLESRSRQRLTQLVVMNRHDLLAAQGLGFVLGENLSLSPGVGIDLSIWQERRPLQPGAELRVLVVGALTRQKGVYDALEAVARVKRCRLDFVGTGPEGKALASKIRKMDVGDRVTLLGQRRDIIELMENADLLLMPSYREGLPKVTLEAMAVGLPVLASAIRGNVDLLANATGATFQAGSVDGLEARLWQAVSNGETLKRWAQGGRNRSRRFDVEHVADGYRLLYTKVLHDEPVGDPWGMIGATT